VAYFIRGELTIRFFLECLNLLFIAGGVFWYYLGSLRNRLIGKGNGRGFASLAVAVVVCAMVLIFARMGSPGNQRAIALDHRRVYDLYNVAHAIHTTWQRADNDTFVLPTSLDDVTSVRIRRSDRVTRGRYEYLPDVGKTTYRLCAVFSTKQRDDDPADSQWNHDSGHQCFVIDARKDVPFMPNQWMVE